MAPDALRVLIDEQLHELHAGGAVALADTDPEGVHRLRVAVRRLRAVLAGRDGAGGEAGAVRAELRWFFGRLGPLRDLDVLLERFRADTTDFSDLEMAAFDRLLGGLVAERATARQRAVKALRGKRYGRLLTELETLGTGSGADTGTGTGTGTDTATEVTADIAGPHDRLRAAVAALGADPADEDLHDLRILGKKLRYAAEIAAAQATQGGKPVRALVKATKRLQDVLGEFQDACVAEKRVRALAPTDPEEAFVAGRLVERERVKQQAMRHQWLDAYLEVDRRATALREQALGSGVDPLVGGGERDAHV